MSGQTISEAEICLQEQLESSEIEAASSDVVAEQGSSHEILKRANQVGETGFWNCSSVKSRKNDTSLNEAIFNKKRSQKIIQALDEAKFSSFHLSVILVAGFGFMVDSYNFFCINMCTKLLGRIYYTKSSCSQINGGSFSCIIKSPGQLPINQNVAVSCLSLAGALVGQVVGGRMGDIYGRKFVFTTSLLTMMLASTSSGMSYGTDANGVVGTLCFWRFVLGIGVGANYPAISVLASEYASSFRRGTLVAFVFAMQGLGYLVACAVVIFVITIFDGAYGGTDCSSFQTGHCYPMTALGASEGEAQRNLWAQHGSVLKPSDDYVWRIVVSFGALPAAIILHYLGSIPESPRFTALVQGRVLQAAREMDEFMGRSDLSADDVPDSDAAPTAASHIALSADELARPPVTLREFVFSKDPNFVAQLAGCAGTWFFLDVAFYSQSLFQKDVFSSIGWLPVANDMTALGEMYNIAKAQAIISLSSTIPGLLATVYTVDYLGRRDVQLMGFFFMTTLMALLSGFYIALLNGALPSFIAMYVFTFFVANFGPNSTTFIIPSELFPAHFRCTCNGLCAAFGKLGAIVGSAGFLYASQLPTANPPGVGLQPALGILAGTSFMGLALTAWLTPETIGQTLEALSSGKADERADSAPTGPVVFRVRA